MYKVSPRNTLLDVKMTVVVRKKFAMVESTNLIKLELEVIRRYVF